MRQLFFLSIFLFSFLSYGQSQYQALILNQELTKNANAIVRSESHKIELTSVKSLKQFYHRVVTILNKHGEKHQNLYVGYDTGIKVNGLAVKIYDKYGKEIQTFKKSDFKDVSAVSGFSLYEDSRVKYLEYTAVDYPYTVDFQYETITENTAYIPFWHPLDDYLLSVEKSTFEIVYDQSVGLFKKEKNFENYTISDQSTPGHLIYVAENIEAIKSEELSPALEDFTPVLMVAPKNFHYEGYTGKIDDWEHIGKWMHHELLYDRTELPASTKTNIMKLVEGIDDPIEKAKKVYRYVQENTRYISVQEGIGGIRPISAIEVDRVKYGDCKGLTNYTKALLEAVGVRSNYTRVYASSEKQKSIDNDFPTFLGQTNHVILNIPIENQDPVWLECTSQTMPFGFLGGFTDDRKVFVIAPEGGKIMTTPSYTDNENLRRTKGSFKVMETSAIEGNIDITSFGVRYDNRYGLSSQSKEDVTTYYKDYWANINNLSVLDYAHQDNKTDVVFSEKVGIYATNYALISGSRILFVANAFDNNDFVPNRYRDRKLPFEIQRGFLDEVDLTIDLPTGYEIEAMPQDKIIESAFGTYKVTFSKDEVAHNILYTRSLMVKKGKYSKDEYNAYREFRKETATMDDMQIVLIKTN